MENPPKKDATTVKQLHTASKTAPKKMETNLKQPFHKPSQPKANTTYAKATSSTPKTNAPTILHPSTMLKLKKNIKENKQKFPTIKPQQTKYRKQ